MLQLPEFVEPMLAVLEREPFDDPDSIFEIKWDGLRALTFASGGAYRIRGRSTADFTARYPELECLAGLPAGTVLDGELVVLRDERPDFHEVMVREQARDPARIHALMATHPVVYVVFDLLYRNFEPVLASPLRDRRGWLQDVVATCGEGRLVFSDGVVGEGLRCYEEVQKNQLEGMVAKRLDSPYRPGRRTDSWIKVKPRQRLQCVILGYLAEGNDLRSLVIAADFDGRLEPVGRVGSGLSGPVRAKLFEDLRARRRDTPLIEGLGKAEWVEPELFCTVSFVERNSNGGLRAPVFEGLVG